MAKMNSPSAVDPARVPADRAWQLRRRRKGRQRHCALARRRRDRLVLLAESSTGVRAAETSGGYQEAMILVKGGYTPDTIVVRTGEPVRLSFRREETAYCSDKVVFADFGKSADLPTGATVPVEFIPKTPGEYAFACPMACSVGS